MNPNRRHWLRALGAALAAGVGAAPAVHADIGDADPALQPLRHAPPAAASRRGPPDPEAWERTLRAPDRLGPAPVRPVDQALLDDLRNGRWADAMRHVKAGAAVNARDARGSHPPALAAAGAQDDLLREMLRRGAVLDRTGEDGFTALGAAAWRGHRSTVRLLARAGADLATWGHNGHPPLHLAALAGHASVVEDLIALGSPVEGLNRARETALDVAASTNQEAVLDLLIRVGADMTKAGRR